MKDKLNKYNQIVKQNVEIIKSNKNIIPTIPKKQLKTIEVEDKPKNINDEYSRVICQTEYLTPNELINSKYLIADENSVEDKPKPIIYKKSILNSKFSQSNKILPKHNANYISENLFDEIIQEIEGENKPKEEPLYVKPSLAKRFFTAK